MTRLKDIADNVARRVLCTKTAASGATRYYHASPKRFHHGDILSGVGHPGGYAGWDSEQGYGGKKRPIEVGIDPDFPSLCLTDSPVPHGTILSALTSKWRVYEVEPLDKVLYNPDNQELRTHRAKVLREVGKALPILKNYNKRKKKGPYDFDQGSRVRTDQDPYNVSWSTHKE